MAHNFGPITCPTHLSSSTKKDLNENLENDDILTLSAQNGYLEIIKWLAEKGADIHAHNDAAIKWCEEIDHSKMVKWLAENDAAVMWREENDHLEDQNQKDDCMDTADSTRKRKSLDYVSRIPNKKYRQKTHSISFG